MNPIHGCCMPCFNFEHLSASVLPADAGGSLAASDLGNWFKWSLAFCQSIQRMRTAVNCQTPSGIFCTDTTRTMSQAVRGGHGMGTGDFSREETMSMLRIAERGCCPLDWKCGRWLNRSTKNIILIIVENLS